MKLTWLGHSCMKLENEGYTVIFDPTEDGYVPGIKPIREKADLVICSHEHGDHNARHRVEMIGGASDTLKSFDDESDYVTFGEKDCPYIITSLESFHDDNSGSQRGKNIITVLDNGNFRIAHFGDIGCMPDDAEIDELRNLDVALIPVGGFYTVDGNKAAEIIKAINPKLVIPMHYRDDSLGFGFDVISTVDDFVKAMGSAEFTESSEIELASSDKSSAADSTDAACETVVKVMIPAGF